ncbi:MAG: carnitine 3-dehydrogenase [Albidovulum sp.]|nr:carnitine 3-dehydrogenase [Albidovulum sp.]
MTHKATIIGGGVIGGGWVARFLLSGWDVAVFDPDPDAERKISEVLGNARRALPALYDKSLPAEGDLVFYDNLGAALDGSTWVQESVPERLKLKHKIHEEVAKLAPADAIIGSSTSGFKPSKLNAVGSRVIVAHPFNPVYLLPLVELVGDAKICAAAGDHLRSIGMFPLIVRKEIEAHIADRLLEAVWREALWLIRDGICSTEELDEAIRMGFGLRWAQMGLFETYRIAGGEAGMKHFMEQFGPALSWPWSKLMDVPEFTEELVELIAGQSDAQSGHKSIRELERLRDDNLIGMMRALKKSGSGVGEVLNAHEDTLPTPGQRKLPVTVDRMIPQSWTDCNNQMNEAHYLEASAQATDRFMEMIGANADYVASGNSYFTVESHIQFVTELHAGEHLVVTTQVLSGSGKRMHLFHRLLRQDGKLAATVETMLIHVDLTSRATSLPTEAVAKCLARFAREHAELELPQGVGRYVGERRDEK